MNRSNSHASTMHAHPHSYHEQQSSPQQHQHHQQQHHQYQNQQQQYQREYMDQEAPSSYQRPMNPPQDGQSIQYRPSSSHQQSMRSQQQQPHHGHDQERQQNHSQPPYQSSQSRSHTSQHHHLHSPSSKTDDQSQHLPGRYPANIPVIQSSDPSFTRRPHSRSFSSNSPSHPYPQYTTPGSSSHYQQSYQPRLHHSASAGHLPAAGHRSAPVTVSAAPGMKQTGNAAGTAPPKRKDPYATAWRTYSKIAEELNLLNPDGTLYPISKEAILKYLHHQSKRIKSSNLHWYVNGLKKHQENLGFAWDDVRYDEQVVALLKELTLHPVPIESNGGAGGNFGYHPSHHIRPSTSAPIDTSKIASLSITSSSNPSPHYSQQQQHHHHHHYQQQQSYSASFTVGSKKHQNQYEDPPPPSHSQRQQHHLYSERPQPQAPHESSRASSFHSAPVQLPSHHMQEDRSIVDTPQTRYKGHSHTLSEVSPVTSTSTTSSPMSSSEIQLAQQSPPSMSNGSNVKRKRYELNSERAARLVSPTSLEGDGLEDHERGTRDADELDVDTLEDMDEDHRERVALKRHASTGTLRIQVKGSALDPMPSDAHLYQRQSESSHREYPVTTPSPGPRENEAGGHFRWGSSDAYLQSRLSPPGSISSIGSTSPASRGATGNSSVTSQRHRRANGVVSSPITSPAVSGTIPPVPQHISNSGNGNNKTTVQFSEVVEYAQQLQTKYGSRCRKHPWGCVVLAEDYHLELTIKMYMDWAGLVASGRLSMDEVPDLPEFRRPNDIGGIGGDEASSSPISPTPGQSTVASGTLKRMTSTPLTASFGSFSLLHQQPTSPPLKSEEQFTFGRMSSSPQQQRHHSPSSSPPPIFGQSPKREGHISDSLMSRIGSPPPQHSMLSPLASKQPLTISINSSAGNGSSDSRQGAGANPPSPLPSSDSRAQSRKIVSSPSLGQYSLHCQSEQETTYASDLQAPPLPDPGKSRLGGAGSALLFNSVEPFSPSEEDMEMSGDEDRGVRERTSRAPAQSHDAGHQEHKGNSCDREADTAAMEEEENEHVHDLRQQVSFQHKQQRAHGTFTLAEQDELEDDGQRASLASEGSRILKERGPLTGETRHMEPDARHFRPRNPSYEVNDAIYEYPVPRPRAFRRESRGERPRGGVYTNSDDVDGMGRAEDHDRVEEVRMGIKSLQSSLSQKGIIVNEPLTNSNDDPITTAEVSMLPSLQQHEQEQHQQQKPRQQSHLDQQVNGDEDSSMVEP